jgi:hypothetical protein
MAFATGMFSGEVFAILGIPVLIMAALWYWLFHYDEIKGISIKEFSNNITVCFAIVIYGFVGVVFLSSFLAVLFGDTAGNIIFMTLLLTLFAIAIFKYFGATQSYREEAAKVRTNAERKKKIFKTAAICMGVLIVIGAISSFLPDSMKLKVNIDLSGREAKVPAGQGTTATVITNNAEMFPDLSPMSKAINILPKGTVVEVLAVNKKYPEWTEITYKGEKGWVETQDIRVNK